MKITLIALPCLLLSPIDGDSWRCDGTLYRAANYDTPEMRSKQPCERRMARQAKQRLTELLATGWPELVPKRNKRGKIVKDRYKRVLAWLYVDGRDVGADLIKRGLARPYDGGKRGRWC